MPVVRAGSLRTPLVLQKLATTPDGMGGKSSNWNDVATLRVRLRALSAEERMRGMQIESKITHEMVARYRADLVGAKTEEWRFVKGARAFNIRSVINEDERNWRLKILAEEGVAT